MVYDYCVEVMYTGKYLPFTCLCLHFQLNSATDDEGVRNIAMGACDVLLDCGCTKPLPQLKLDDVPKLIQCAALHSTVLKIKSELDQFMAGINEAGSLHVIQEYPSFFRPMFVASDTNLLNAGEFVEVPGNEAVVSIM